VPSTCKYLKLKIKLENVNSNINFNQIIPKQKKKKVPQHATIKKHGKPTANINP
jgi:hypothetical protein